MTPDQIQYLVTAGILGGLIVGSGAGYWFRGWNNPSTLDTVYKASREQWSPNVTTEALIDAVGADHVEMYADALGIAERQRETILLQCKTIEMQRQHIKDLDARIAKLEHEADGLRQLL